MVRAITREEGRVIRVVFNRDLGAQVHTIEGDMELVVGVAPLRILQGDVPQETREQAVQWVVQHREELLTAWRRFERGDNPFVSE